MENLLFIKVHAANIHDTVSGGDIFAGAVEKYPSTKGVCAMPDIEKSLKML